MKLVLHDIDWNPFNYFLLKDFHDYQKNFLSGCYMSTCLYTYQVHMLENKILFNKMKIIFGEE